MIRFVDWVMWSMFESPGQRMSLRMRLLISVWMSRREEEGNSSEEEEDYY